MRTRRVPCTWCGKQLWDSRGVSELRDNGVAEHIVHYHVRCYEESRGTAKPKRVR